MNITGSISSCSVALLLAVISPIAVATSSWVGSYQYGDVIPGSTENSAMVSEVRLEILRDGSCRIDHDGFQTYEHMTCRARLGAESIDLIYEDNLDGSRSDLHYQRGDVLFSLHSKVTSEAILTYWGKLRPSSAQNLEGAYLERVE